MELELALKITRTRDDINSLTDLRISKDPHGPLFASKETKTMFVLIAHLKDYREDNIDIKINEDGSRIEIAGAKPVEEMVLKRWIMWNKKLKLRTFKKVFRVPDGVILDKIKAKFNEEDSALTITMPKMVKEIVGVVIEEVKEEEVDKGTQETGNNIDPEPETTSEQESKEAEQVVETTKPEIAQTTAGESPMEESDRGGTSATEDGLIEQESKKMEEILNIDPEPETTSVQESKEDEQVVETKPEIAQTTAGEAPMEESDRAGTSATEDGLIEEESKEIGEVSDNKGESDAMENIPQEVPERVGHIVEETTQEIEDQMEVKESIPEKVEPSASKAEEPQSEEIPELKEDTPEAEKEVVRSELLVTGVEEPIKPEPDQEEQAENKEQVHEQEIDQARNEIQESVDKVESNAKENVPERVGQMVKEASQEIEDQMEVKESTPEKVEPPSASIALEPKEVLPKREAQEQKTTMPPPVEQQQPQEIPELEEETAEAEKGVEGPELSVTGVEERKTNEKREIKSKDVKELEKQEAGVGVEEPIKPEPDQEEQAANEIQESVAKVEPDATKNVPERVRQIVQQTLQEIEDQMQVKESTPEKVEEPSASNALEPKEVQPERETLEPETTMPSPIEEPQPKEIPELKEETSEAEKEVEPPSASIALEPKEVLPKREAQEHKTTMPPPVEQQQPQEIPELEEETAEAEKEVEGPELSVTGVEERKTNEKREIKSKVVKEIEKQEAGVGVEEPIKPEPDQEEQAANEIQESVDKVEPDATENVPERVRQIVEQTLKEIEDQMQVKESTPEKVEPSASNALEPKEVQPEQETLEPETAMPSPVEEPQPKEIPELKEETSEAEKEVEPTSASIALELKEVLPKREAQKHKTTMPPPVEQPPQEIPELEEETAESEKEVEGPELSVTGVEERKTNEKSEIKSKVVKELEKQEAGVGVEEPIKPEPDQEEQAANEIQESVDKVEPDATENVPERVRQIVEQTLQEIEDQMQVKESTPEKVEESSASNALEPKEVQPEGETLEPETTMPSPVEEPQPKEIPELKEETSEAQKEVVGSELSVTGVEEHLTNEKSQIKSNLVEELKRQEAGVNVEEPTKPEPDQEELAENKEQVHQQETDQARKKIQESKDKVESDAMEDVPERVGQIIEETSKEIEYQMEVTESTPVKVEQPSASIALEPKEVQPKRETQEHEATMPPPVEEPQPQEIPKLEETSEAEKEVEGSELSATRVEEHKTNENGPIKSNVVEELEKEEAGVGVEEPIKPEPEQEEQVENQKHAHELETDQARNEVQESVEKVESDAMKNVPERVGQIVEETSKEIEDQMEVKESTPEKVDEPSVSIALEPKEVQPKQETPELEIKMPPPVEEPQHEELKEETPEAEKGVVVSELSLTSVEEHKTNEKCQIEINVVEELEKQEAGVGVEEPIKTEPDQEVQAENKEQVQELETDKARNEIQESMDKVESDATENVPEKVGQIGEEPSQEIEYQMEVTESTPEKVEQPSASIALEPKEVQPKQETRELKTKMPPPVEEPQPQEIPELEEETSEAEKEVEGSELSVTRVEEHKTKEKSPIKSNVVEELEKEEAGVGIEEPIKPEPAQEEQVENKKHAHELETDQARNEVQESVEKVESDATENVPERVDQIVEETSKEIEDQMEVKESTPEKVGEPSVSIALEPKEVQPKQETRELKTKMPPPVEEPQPQQIPELEEETSEAEKEVEGSELSVTRVEEHKTKEKSPIKSNVVEELEKEEAGVGIEEPIKPEPAQEEQVENKKHAHELETDQARNEVQESVEKVESDATENVPERVDQIVEETSKEIEDQMEVKESTPEKVGEPSVSIALEPKEVQPKQETPELETKMPPPVEEPQPEEIPELKDETPEAEKEVPGSELSVNGVEENKTNGKSPIKSNVAEELEKEEAGVGVEEPIKPEPAQEEQVENKKHAHELETDQARNEVQELVEKVESDATENVPERVSQIVEETSKEIEDQMEVKQSTPEKVDKPSVYIALEPKEVQPKQETSELKTKMPPPVEEPQHEEIPELKEETPESEKEVAGSELSVNGVGEHKTNGKSQIECNVADELEKQEADVGIEEPIKPEPDQEEQTANTEHVHEQETDQARNEIQESMDKVESDATENVPEKVGQIGEETSKEIEDQMEVKESTPEKVDEPSVSIAFEPKEVQPKQETQELETKMPPPVEEPQHEEMKEETPEAEKGVVVSELSLTSVEEHKTNEKCQIEINVVEELEKQEVGVGVEEPIKTEPDQEVQAENKEQVHELETDQAKNEIQESMDKVESDATENVPEKVGQIGEETSKEIEDQMEVKESTPEKVDEPSVSIALEPKEGQPKRETRELETKMPPPVEESQPEEIPELKEETPEAEKEVPGTELSVNGVEGHKTNGKSQIECNVVEELEKEEAGVGVEEPIKPEPDQEEQVENKKHAHELETDQARNEIQKSTDKVESDATENVPEKVGQIGEETSKEIEDQMEVKESTPEKVDKPSVSIALEPKEVQPKQETLELETKMPPPVEEPQHEEMKEETPEAEKGAVVSELSVTSIEEHKTNEKCQIEINVVEELGKQEGGVGVEEPIKTEPDQEVQAENKEQVHELETDQARNEIQESMDKVESDAMENVPEKVGQIGEETSKDIEDQMEVKESTPEKVDEPSASIALEPKEVQPKRETRELETKMPPPVEEPQPEEIPELKEETPEAKKEVAGSELSVNGVEEHKTNGKIQIECNVVEELEKQEADVGIEEPIKPEPDQEEQTANKEHVHEQETDQASNEIQESVDEARLTGEEERNERINPEVEQLIDGSEGPLQENKKKKKKPNLCPSLVVGSATLVSLIVIVIRVIRSDHEQETVQTRNEIHELVDEARLTKEEERNENVNPELEKQIDRSEGPIQENENEQKPDLCPSLVVAGSATLISLVVLVIGLIRSNKR